jgi:hypothetical protein
MSRLLLKARPTPAQLADRLRPPRPDGLELYLDAADIADQAALDGVVARLEALELPPELVLLIEGPVGSLDGRFFDLTRGAEADYEVVRRLAAPAARIGAKAVNVHLIAPSAEARELSLEARQRLLEASLPLSRFFVEAVTAAGAVPTVENMPPILRMRQGGFFYSAIGLAAEDLAWLCDRVPGLRTTLDLSHAGLYLNARRHAALGNGSAEEPGAFPELFGFVRQLPAVDGLLAYAESLGRTLLTCHVANASGLLGEGEPYDRGDLDLDAVVRALAPRTSYFVTETLERDPDSAVEMARALAGMRRALGTGVGR